MPVRFRVILFPEKPIPEEELYPDRIHGLFFSLLGERLSRELHESYKLKPFSINLRTKDKDGSNQLLLEISFLKDELFPRFLSSLMLEKDNNLHLGNIRLRKLRKPVLRESDILSYDSLLEKTKPSKRLIFRFITPTTFKKGRADYPLPDPRLIFKGLIKKWHTFSEIRIDRELTEVIEYGVKVAGAWVKTERVFLSDRSFITCFRGKVVLSLEDLATEEIKWLCTLARFAEFAGVGRKVTMGFGKVVLLQENILQP